MIDNEIHYIKKEMPDSVNNLGFILLFSGAGLGILAFFVDPVRTMHNYLIMYMFLLSIGLGSLFLIAIEYIVGADWSVPIRRIIEFISSIIPYLIVFVLPLIFSMDNLFSWTHTDPIQNDHILKAKSPYLNTSFFIIRAGIFILIWVVFYLILTKNSLKQDATKNVKLSKVNIRTSAIFLPVFAITITFTAIDWMMSLEPHWYSTIFGVYFFSGTVVGALAAVTLAVVLLKQYGYLHGNINEDHLYSLGALMFAFVNFWAYIAFSQFMLIWYANLPEENYWFINRWQNGWWIVSLLLILVNFIVPYFVLLSQSSKMDHKKLKFISIWLLAAHFIDLYWLIMPNNYKYFYLSWIDFVFPLLAAGAIIVSFFMKAKRHNLLPVGDPKIQRGLNFHL